MATTSRTRRIVTCEAMALGHPDKLCDRISDALLDAHLARDPFTRCGIEAAASGNEVWVFGQVASRDPLTHAEIEAVARRVIRETGYERAEEGIDPATCTVRVTPFWRMLTQSPGLMSLAGLATCSFTATRPLRISSVANERVLKKRAAQSHLSIRTLSMPGIVTAPPAKPRQRMRKPTLSRLASSMAKKQQAKNRQI